MPEQSNRRGRHPFDRVKRSVSFRVKDQVGCLSLCTESIANLSCPSLRFCAQQVRRKGSMWTDGFQPLSFQQSQSRPISPPKAVSDSALYCGTYVQQSRSCRDKVAQDVAS
jgi:hypothetical protein